MFWIVHGADSCRGCWKTAIVIIIPKKLLYIKLPHHGPKTDVDPTHANCLIKAYCCAYSKPQKKEVGIQFFMGGNKFEETNERSLHTE